MKKETGLLSFLTLFQLSLVSAAGPADGFRVIFDQLRQFLVYLIQFISGVIFDINRFDEYLISKIILFIILYIVVFTAIQKSEIFGRKNKAANVIISIAVAILSIRFIPDNNFMQTLLLPYGAFGAAVTSLLPIVIFNFFVHNNLVGSVTRRAAWIFFGAFFVGLYWMRYNELSAAAGWIYFISFTIIFISIVFDKSLHKFVAYRKINEFLVGANRATIVRLQNEYIDSLDNHSPDAERRRQFIRQKLRELGSDLSSLP